MFTQRRSKPTNNPYYMRIANGGYNAAIAGYPNDSTATVLSNCVGYANGRFNEIGNYGKCKYQIHCNAENFIERAQSLGLVISSKPVPGGIMVWQYGTLSGIDGCGHVEVVEEIIDANTIYTSASNYGAEAFYNAKRSNLNGRWGMASGFKFRGCIVNPAVKYDEKVPSANNKPADQILTIGSVCRSEGFYVEQLKKIDGKWMMYNSWVGGWIPCSQVHEVDRRDGKMDNILHKGSGVAFDGVNGKLTVAIDPRKGYGVDVKNDTVYIKELGYWIKSRCLYELKDGR